MALIPDTPFAALQVGLFVLALFTSHYLVLAGGAWLWFNVLFREHYAPRRIQQDPAPRERPLLELGLSLSSFVVFSVLVVFIFWLSWLGVAGVRLDDAPTNWGWVAATVVIIAFWHDTYYYWAHRWMHHPRLYRHVHRMHHRFVNPTPFASYAFHPLEAVLEAAWFLPLALIMPIDPEAMAIYMVVLTVLNIVSHLGVETYPAWVARWFITSTHHNLHHSRGRGHFMLYFNIWDRVMGTNEPDYHDLIASINERAWTTRGGEPAGNSVGNSVSRVAGNPLTAR